MYSIYKLPTVLLTEQYETQLEKMYASCLQ